MTFKYPYLFGKLKQFYGLDFPFLLLLENSLQADGNARVCFTADVYLARPPCLSSFCILASVLTCCDQRRLLAARMFFPWNRKPCCLLLAEVISCIFIFVCIPCAGTAPWLLSFRTVSTETKYSYTSALLSFRTRQTLFPLHFDQKKNVSAFGACSGVGVLARSCMSHSALPQEKMLPHSALAQCSSVSALIAHSRAN